MKTYTINVPSGEYSITSNDPDFIIYDAYEQFLANNLDRNDLDHLAQISDDVFEFIKITR
jgi:hypothetical protein